MNALAATADQFSSFFAPFVPPTPAAVQTPIFSNLISAFFGAGAEPEPAATDMIATKAAPNQIADALIRSMLGAQTQAPAPVAAASDPTIASLPAPTAIAIAPSGANPTAAAPTGGQTADRAGNSTKDPTNDMTGDPTADPNPAAPAAPQVAQTERQTSDPVQENSSPQPSVGAPYPLADRTAPVDLPAPAVKMPAADDQTAPGSNAPLRKQDRRDKRAGENAPVVPGTAADVSGIVGFQGSAAPCGRGSENGQDLSTKSNGTAQDFLSPRSDREQAAGPRVAPDRADFDSAAVQIPVTRETRGASIPVAFQAKLSPIEQAPAVSFVPTNATDEGAGPVTNEPAALRQWTEPARDNAIAAAPKTDDDAAAPVERKATTDSVPADSFASGSFTKDSQAKDSDPRDTTPRAAAASSQNTFFVRPQDAPVALDRPAASIETRLAAPFRAVADTLRTSEVTASAAVQLVAPHAGPLQTIAVRIARADAPPVELRVAERGGEIHVSVRTPDEGLQSSLRQDLGTLSHSLERAGYRAETYVPRESVTPAARAGNSDFRDRESQQNFSGRGSGDAQQQRRDPRQQRDPRSRQWIQELENVK